MSSFRRVGELRAVGVAAALGLSFAARSAAAQDVPVPAKLQAAIFGKVFKYCSTLRDKKINVAIVADNGSADLANELKEGFDKAGIASTIVNPSRVSSAAKDATVLYLTPGTVASASVAKSTGMLTITGVESFVRDGKVAVGVTLAGKKPKILVHMKRLEEEGHQLSSHVLRLADIIR